MRNIATFLGYLVIAAIVFYVVMFLFAESVPLPYGSMPDSMKIERMIAAELIECSVASGDQGIAASFVFGASKSDIASVLVDALTRDRLLEERDAICPGTAK